MHSGVSLESSEYIPTEASSQGSSLQTRGTINIINPRLVATLDKCRVSDRNAVQLIISVALALGVDVKEIIVNKESIRSCRSKLRETQAENIRQKFNDIELNATVLQRDGKLIQNLVKREVLDRLPTVISDGDTEKLLGVPELENGKGVSQATAIHEVLSDWGLLDSVKAICCDTTASYLGNIQGAATLLQQMLKKDLLYLPCRHHIYELFLRSVFDKKMPQPSGPNVPLFERFKDSWKTIVQSEYCIGLDNEYVEKNLKNHVDDIEAFVNKKLEGKHARNDYKELLELTKIFCGKTPAHEVKFKHPGAHHHACWMAKAIYPSKIFLFRQQFKLTAKEEKSLSEICVFIVTIYVKAWFIAPDASQAPKHDLEFIKKLINYKFVDPTVLNVTLSKFINHLWYLASETAAMSFFDEKLSVSLKKKIASELFEDGDSDDTKYKKFPIKLNEIERLINIDMDYYINSHSIEFFKRFNISHGFLKTDPSTWSENNEYQKGLKISRRLKIVNDIAERAVKLVEDYTNILSQNESQTQYLFQILTDYRKQFPDSNKGTLNKNFI